MKIIKTVLIIKSRKEKTGDNIEREREREREREIIVFCCATWIIDCRFDFLSF